MKKRYSIILWKKLCELLNEHGQMTAYVSAMSSGGFRTTHYQNTTNEYRKHKR